MFGCAFEKLHVDVGAVGRNKIAEEEDLKMKSAGVDGLKLTGTVGFRVSNYTVHEVDVVEER